MAVLNDVRVLLADSDPVSLAVASNVLETAGIAVVGKAGDPAQAIEMARLHHPTVAVVDVALGGMGAAVTAKRLRELPDQRIEIVALAGFNEANQLGEMVSSGTGAYVIKGKPAELIAAVRAVSAGSGLLSAEASRPVLEEIQNLYDRERARNGELELMVTQLQALSVTDWLTGLKNHGYFFDRLSEELERSRRYDRPLAVIMADLDDFKRINDSYGHAAGDAVLRAVGEVFRTQLREVDVACRVGGEEFGVIMPETDSDGAQMAAERLRLAAHEAAVPGVGTVKLSLGVAVFPDDAAGRDELVAQADQALYVAKHEGKDMVVLAGSRSDVATAPQESPLDPVVGGLLNAMRLRAPHTAEHAIRVAELATALAQRMGLNASGVKVVRTAALLHDIGRLTLPDAILNSTGALADSDWELIRRHPRNAFEMLNGLVAPEVANIVLTHHEHLDGSGYPHGISGDQIPLPARMVLVCDAYDAMISHRLYRGAKSSKTAIQELFAASGAQLDRAVVGAFSEMMDEERRNVVDLPLSNVG
jgi:diguanylate cyclase (GGDEF)-like protein/putative nucleotidyltransferase with HDIG domain